MSDNDPEYLTEIDEAPITVRHAAPTDIDVLRNAGNVQLYSTVSSQSVLSLFLCIP